MDLETHENEYNFNSQVEKIEGDSTYNTEYEDYYNTPIPPCCRIMPYTIIPAGFIPVPPYYPETEDNIDKEEDMSDDFENLTRSRRRRRRRRRRHYYDYPYYYPGGFPFWLWWFL